MPDSIIEILLRVEFALTFRSQLFTNVTAPDTVVFSNVMLSASVAEMFPLTVVPLVTVSVPPLLTITEPFTVAPLRVQDTPFTLTLA